MSQGHLAVSSLFRDLLRVDYFKSGVALFLLYSALNVFQRGVRNVARRIKNSCVLSVQIDSKDESYRWLIEWLGAHPYSQSAAELNLITSYDSDNTSSTRPRIIFTPAIGNHFFNYKGSFIWLNRSRDSNLTDLTNGGFIENITITMFGKNRKKITTLIDDAMELYYAKDEGKTVVYTNVGGGWGRTGSARAPRPLTSVILPEGTIFSTITPKGIKESVVSDIKKFLDNSKWYRDMGIPYRRGYLFYGHPGSGKTSLIYALAGAFRMNICIVNLSEKHMNDETLNQLLNCAPIRSVLVLEDIDAAFRQREGDTTTVTFSGLLNALDGIAAQEGKILFMTTNKIEVLDPALTRPGRVDVSYFFGLASRNQLLEMFLRFFPTASQSMSKDFISLIPNESITMAELQGFLLKNRDNPENAISNLPSFISTIQKRKLSLKSSQDSDT